MKIGSSRKDLKITNVESREVNTAPDKVATKAVLICSDPNGIDYQIDEAWILDRAGDPTHKGMWISTDPAGKLDARSVLVQVMKYLGVVTPAELIGKEMSTWPKENGYKAIIACEHEKFKDEE